ncbi:hypothetical protein N7471_005754 [Penicillium samsonianum]|uniref:uncharacterized protein n=1 Tax=Penicillium samsonianum TaxID=1882272 RepID=UPI002547E890|nr:uncharacterized protein N7471_005754 [Penicillium samsonianum]KAJ6139268.1 hypothetical protein N7471_005754 [Penicillium samsonianum]
MCDDKPQPEDFDNPDILNAVNPHPKWGYMHGPIVDRNPAWVPSAHREFPSRRIKAKELTLGLLLDPPDHPLNIASRYNGLVCDVKVDKTQMCGKTFGSLRSFDMHMEMYHPACFVPSLVANFNEGASSHAAKNAMKRWILTGGWRDASYRYEPGRCKPKSPIGRMCDELEEIATVQLSPRTNPEDHEDSDAPSAEVNNTAAVTKRIEVIDLTD